MKELILGLLAWGIMSSYGESTHAKVKIIPAATLSEIPGIKAYETHTKIVFHVELPNYDHRTILDPAHGTTVNCKPNNILCNTRLLTSMVMEDYMRNVQDAIAMNKGRRKRQLGVLIGAGIAGALGGGYLVHSVESMLTPSLYGTQKDMEEYMNKLRSSIQQNQRNLLLAEANITKFADDVTKNIEGIRHEISDMVERDWFSESLMSCTQRTLPSKMIPTEILLDELLKLKPKLEGAGRTLAIDTADIYSYHKLPLVDCFFSEKQATVTVNVPIKQKTENWRIFEILHTKFAYNNQVCDLYPQDSKYLAVGNTKAVLIDSHMARYCTISQNRLCLIPQFTRDSSQSLNCAVGMLHNKPVGELSKVCAFRCSTNSELIINQLDERVLMITNIEKVDIACPGKLEQFKFNKTGAVEVHMRCNCSMLLDGKMKIDPPFYCISEVSNSEYVFRTTPNLWSSLDHAIGSSAQYFNEHSNHTLNPLWPYTVPVLNLTPTTAPILNEFQYDDGITVDRIWLLCLSVLLGIMCILLGYMMVLVLRY